jgi:hypothetical protein
MLVEEDTHPMRCGHPIHDKCLTEPGKCARCEVVQLVEVRRAEMRSRYTGAINTVLQLHGFILLSCLIVLIFDQFHGLLPTHNMTAVEIVEHCEELSLINRVFHSLCVTLYFFLFCQTIVAGCYNFLTDYQRRQLCRIDRIAALHIITFFCAWWYLYVQTASFIGSPLYWACAIALLVECGDLYAFSLCEWTIHPDLDGEPMLMQWRKPPAHVEVR